MRPLVEAALYRYLEKKSALYYGKLLELRVEIERWLTYIPQTFPQYTSHTIDHSEEIILQVSHLLFSNNNPDKFQVELSGVEAYALCAAAYLHDAGMVASEDEKAKILSSNEWKLWLEKSPHARLEMEKIGALREAESDDKTVNNFLADVALRRLLSDFIRRQHHDRSSDFAQLNQNNLGRYGFDDPALIKTIAALCRGHGLRRNDLDDETEYPLARQVRGENCNVRLLAIFLRLGDLLDLRVSRACPICLSAASPLPPDSAEHWKQYSAIDQFFVSGERINLVAKCNSVEQHRILADWFRWIAEEVSEAPVLVARRKLHQEWAPPQAEIGKDIIVEPAMGATYRPVDWKFEISLDNVLRRFTNDTYAEKGAFIRELIQNSLDASRCQLSFGLKGADLKNPALLDADVLKPYEIFVEIRDEVLANGISTQVVEVSDVGTGMTEQTITSHFLQIGRSFYETENFRRTYRFSPNSRFGIGFLSVFGSSSHVTVETRATNQACGLRLTLTGPKNYLIVEDVMKCERGTTITVRLNQNIQFKPGELTRYLLDWLRGTEIPIRVSDFGRTETIIRASLLPSCFDLPDAETKGARYRLRHFGFAEREGLFDLYVLALSRKGGPEDWTKIPSWSAYRDFNPHAQYERLPSNVLTASGIRTNATFPGAVYGWGGREVIDVRDGSVVPDLSRTEFDVSQKDGTACARRNEFWLRVIKQNIDAWRSVAPDSRSAYLQRLWDQFDIEPEFWCSLPKAVKWYKNGRAHFSSMKQLLRQKSIYVVVHNDDGYNWRASEIPTPPKSILGVHENTISYREMRSWSNRAVNLFNRAYIPHASEELSDSWRIVKFMHQGKSSRPSPLATAVKYYSDQVFFVRINCAAGTRKIIPFYLEDRGSYVLVTDEKLAGIVEGVGTLAEAETPQGSAAKRFLIVLHDIINSPHNSEFISFVKNWNLVPGLPQSLKVEPGAFGIGKW